MWKELFLLVVFIAVAKSSKTQCRHDSQCGSDECCCYNDGTMVASKKRQLVFPGGALGGWCEKYKQNGDHCSSIDKMIGFCECGPGLTCTWVKDPTVAQPVPVIVKRGAPPPGGYEKCIPEPSH